MTSVEERHDDPRLVSLGHGLSETMLPDVMPELRSQSYDRQSGPQQQLVSVPLRYIYTLISVIESHENRIGQLEGLIAGLMDRPAALTEIQSKILVRLEPMLSAYSRGTYLAISYASEIVAADKTLGGLAKQVSELTLPLGRLFVHRIGSNSPVSSV